MPFVQCCSVAALCFAVRTAGISLHFYSFQHTIYSPEWFLQHPLIHYPQLISNWISLRHAPWRVCMLRSMYGCTCLLDRCCGSHHPLPCHFWRECSPPSCTNDIPSVNPVCISCPDIQLYTVVVSPSILQIHTDERKQWQSSSASGKTVLKLTNNCQKLLVDLLAIGC